MSKEDKMEASKVKSALEYFCDTGIAIGPMEIEHIGASTELLTLSGEFCYREQMTPIQRPKYGSLGEKEQVIQSAKQWWLKKKERMDDEIMENPEALSFYWMVSIAINRVQKRKRENQEEPTLFWINTWNWVRHYNSQLPEGIEPINRGDYEYDQGVYLTYHSGDDKIEPTNFWELEILDALGIAEGAWSIEEVAGFDKSKLLRFNRAKILKSHLDISHPAVVQ